MALDSDANRCRRPAKRGIQYHGDPELYGYLNDRTEPTWVIAYLCDVHSRLIAECK